MDDDYDEYTDENVVCIVCMSDTRDTLMLPCKHLCVCSDCGTLLHVVLLVISNDSLNLNPDQTRM